VTEEIDEDFVFENSAASIYRVVLLCGLYIQVGVILQPLYTEWCYSAASIYRVVLFCSLYIQDGFIHTMKKVAAVSFSYVSNFLPE